MASNPAHSPQTDARRGGQDDVQASSGTATRSNDRLPTTSSSPSMTSEDSETVLLNNSSSTQAPTNSISEHATPRPSMPPRSSTLGVKKCWICICDSTEDDTVDPPVWISPCTCNLTAHELCLLDWVADLENPKNRKRNPPPNKILCPQCKSEIKVARPNSYTVNAVRAVDRSLGRLVLPGLGLSVLSTVYAGLSVHGFCSVWIVCGHEHANRIVQGLPHHMWWALGYGLIPLSLIFSRTKYSDFVQPLGTFFLLATQLSESWEIDMTMWPPLPSTVFACLPVARNTYNFLYEKAFGELNRKWMAEVQPRQTERVEGQEDNLADAANAQEDAMDDAGDGGLVVQLEVNIGPEVEEGPGPAGGADNTNNGGQQGEGANQNGDEGGVQQILGERQNEIVESTSGLGQTLLGALVFPGVAAGMGGLLSFALPSDWLTNANMMNGRPGLLRHRWGRSVVGGCLFVVLKDALVLYCRWKLAQTHRQRRVMDYDKTTKKYKMPAS